MDKIISQKKFVKTFGENEKIVVTAEIKSLSGQTPYFAITADIYQNSRHESAGCQHDEVVKHFPELEKFIKWHLVSTIKPMYYIENTVYHVEQGKLDYARSTAVWAEATDEDLQQPKIHLIAALNARLPQLMEDFRKDMMELFAENQLTESQLAC